MNSTKLRCALGLGGFLLNFRLNARITCKLEIKLLCVRIEVILRFAAEVDVAPESACKLILVNPSERVRVQTREAEQREGEAVEGAREADVPDERRHLQVVLVLSVHAGNVKKCRNSGRKATEHIELVKLT